MKRKTKRAKATHYERSMARRTGATVTKLRAEQKGIDALAQARARYADSRSCGDGIAKALDAFRTDKGLDLEALKKCLRDNEIELPMVDMTRVGSLGRFRMCAGLSIRAAARKRLVVIGDKKFGSKRAKTWPR